MSNSYPLMPQARHQDLEEGGNPERGIVDGHRDQPQSTPNQPTLNRLLGQGESDYGDSSRPIYFMYSKIAGEEDSKIVENCSKEADGILIFSGLFSATVAALLTISIPDLKPNSQDTSAFYLKNIYQLQALGNPNVSHPSIPSALAEPAPFSPPKYAIWVNSLWFLSLAISLSCATEATTVRNWAVQYFSVSRPPHYTSEKQARIRAIFAKGNPGPNVIWGTSGGPVFLHLSLFLFIAGGLIYLFNINRSVFYAVVWWVGYMTISYTRATVAVFFEPHNLFHTPLSPLALRIYLSIFYAVLQVCSCIPPIHNLRDNIRRHHRDLSDRYSKGFLNGKRREAEKIALNPSSGVDVLILERILTTLDEDRALETFFDAIPGFCNSKSTLSIPVQKLRQALDVFLDRIFSSSLISESVRTGRFITSLNAAHAALGPSTVSEILDNIFDGRWDKALKSVEIGHALRHWGRGRDHDLEVRRIVACITVRAWERDDCWIKLVKEAFGVPDHVLRDSLPHGNSVLLSILIHISRETNRAGSWTSGILSSLSKFDIRNTLPGLQHEFCAMWNENALGARNRGPYSIPALVLREIRHLYIALHQNCDAAPTLFSASTDSFHAILFEPSSYPLCDVASHRPDSIPHFPVPLLAPPANSLDPHRSTYACSTVLREATIITGPPFPSDPTSLSEIGDSSRAPAVTSLALPVYTSRRPTDASPPGAVDVGLKGATLSHPLGGTTQHDMVLPYAEPDTGEILSTASIPAAPASTPYVRNRPLGSFGASIAFTPDPLLPASPVVSFPIPTSPPQLPNAEFIALSTMTIAATSSRLANNASLPRLRARGLVNSGSMCFANAVLQLLVRSPPFWNLFRELGDLKSQRGAGDAESGGSATPLVDATVRFFEEFMFEEEEPPPTQQPLQQPREGKETKKTHNAADPFEPMYMYDAMKEKRQLKILLDGQQQDAEEFFRLYLEALDDELLALLASVSGHKLATVAPGVEDREVSHADHTNVGFTASSAESPISPIFNGRSRSTVRAPNQPDSITVQDWRLLQLNIQLDLVHTVKDALAHISQPQPVQAGQLSPSEVTQQVQIEALPPVLVLHFKRFLYDAAADGIVKIDNPVQFAPELKIPLEIMAPVAGISEEPVHYKLYGVLYHHGESAGSGHYTVEVLHPNEDSGSGEAWLYIDDEAVGAVRHEDVFGGQGNERVDDRCAYMLFYCRTAPARAL